jgi:hypothetical protein
MTDDELNMPCRCSHSRRWHPEPTKRTGGYCLMAGCRCRGFTRAAEPEPDVPATTTGYTAEDWERRAAAAALGMPAEVVGPFQALIMSLVGH